MQLTASNNSLIQSYCFSVINTVLRSVRLATNHLRVAGHLLFGVGNAGSNPVQTTTEFQTVNAWSARQLHSLIKTRSIALFAVKDVSVESRCDTNKKDMEDLENKIIDLLNEAGEKLSKDDFDVLAESIIDYIDDIARSKR